MLYYGSRISENMTKTPEGYLICMNVPINRIGKQTYLNKEINIDDSLDGNEQIDIVRDEKDVFDKATLASFEGKAVVDEHPDEDVDVNNNEMYSKGHCQNVRRVGDYTVADLYITDPNLIREIENGKREISCGYTCDFEPDENGNYKQTNIRGNHIAVVNSGRAGENVSIKDSQIKDALYSKRGVELDNAIQKTEDYNKLKSILNDVIKFRNELDRGEEKFLVEKIKYKIEYIKRTLGINDSQVKDDYDPLKNVDRSVAMIMGSHQTPSVKKTKLEDFKKELLNGKYRLTGTQYGKAKEMIESAIKRLRINDSSIKDYSLLFNEYYEKLKNALTKKEVAKIQRELVDMLAKDKIRSQEYTMLMNYSNDKYNKINDSQGDNMIKDVDVNNVLKELKIIQTQMKNAKSLRKVKQLEQEASKKVTQVVDKIKSKQYKNKIEDLKKLTDMVGEIRELVFELESSDTIEDAEPVKRVELVIEKNGQKKTKQITATEEQIERIKRTGILGGEKVLEVKVVDSTYANHLKNIKDNDYKTQLKRIVDVRGVKDSKVKDDTNAYSKILSDFAKCKNESQLISSYNKNKQNIAKLDKKELDKVYKIFKDALNNMTKDSKFDTRRKENEYLYNKTGKLEDLIFSKKITYNEAMNEIKKLQQDIKPLKATSHEWDSYFIELKRIAQKYLQDSKMKDSPASRRAAVIKSVKKK